MNQDKAGWEKKITDSMVCALFPAENGKISLIIWGEDEPVQVELTREKALLVAAELNRYAQGLC